jgi:hypothetical protein
LFFEFYSNANITASGYKLVKRKISRYQAKFEDPFLRIPILIKKHEWEWQSVGAIAAFGGGLLSPMIGILLDLIASVTRTNFLRLPLSKISIVFYVLTFPLLALGSHCLDLLEKNSPDSPPDNLQTHKFDLGLKA